MRTITLRIKKVYFDAIRSREKLAEYRADTLFYRRMLRSENRSKVTELKLHYQKEERIRCEVKSIRLIRTPRDVMHIIKTEMCWKISLGDVHEGW